jgi:putative ABC transport system permease protein
VVAVSPEVRGRAQLVAGNANWGTQNVLGESEEYLNIRAWPLDSGSMFGEQDVRGANKVAVIGQTIAKQLYGDDNPVGKIMRINNVPFIVTGVLSPKGLSLQGSDQDDVVIIPYTSAMKRVMGRTSLGSMNIQVGKDSDLTPAQTQIIALLRQRHKITPPKEDDFTVRNQEEIAKLQTASTDVMTLLLAVAASVSLLVGGIGIMNIMLVSVTERTREIGIRIAVGAHGKDILLQFLIEAVTLSCMGGLIGVLFGIAGAKGISHFLGWPSLISIPSIVISFLVSAFVGISFGFFPAHKASRLDPIDALRYE